MTLKASLAAALFAASAVTAAETTLQTDRDRISYTLGADIGNSLRRMEADVDLEKVTAGLRDALTGGKLLLTEEQLAQNLQTFQTQLQQKMLAKRQAEGEKGIQEGAKFLAENKTKEGVVTLPSGLQYKVITAGDASKPKPKPSDTVTTHYRGTLINGTEFDSSYKRNEPATFPVSGVIPGWTEALQLMTVGSKWQLFIPSNLAYAERGAGADIPPNSVLIFDIELLSVAP